MQEALRITSLWLQNICSSKYVAMYATKLVAEKSIQVLPFSRANGFNVFPSS